MGSRLYRFARGEDERPVEPDTPTKSVSAETTFNQDLRTLEALKSELWPLAETVSRRLKKAELAAANVVLKLKGADFRTATRHHRLPDPTQLARLLFEAALPLLQAEADGRAFRLIGIGTDDLVEGGRADPPSLLDPGRLRAAKVERAIDAVREKLGQDAIGRGLGRPKPRRS